MFSDSVTFVFPNTVIISLDFANMFLRVSVLEGN